MKKQKSKEAHKVLQLMDEDHEYHEAINIVCATIGVKRAKLEKEVNRYI